MITYLQQLGKARQDDDPSEPAWRPPRVWDNYWLITIVAVLVAALGLVYGLSVTPVYEANTIIQIKRSPPLSGEAQGDIPVATEVEILRSRSLIGGVVDALQLDINVEPKRFPVIGAYIAGKNAELSEPGLFGVGGYAWGAEQARVTVFNVPPALRREPWTLSAADDGGFTLVHAGSKVALRGTVGRLATAQTRFGPVEVLVAELQANPGAQFLVSRSPRYQVVEQLRKSLVVSETGKQSNVIGITLRGSKPDLISRILNEIGKQYIRQQVAQRAGEAKKALAFYDRQIEASAATLQRLEARLSQLLRSRGVSDLSEEAKALSQQSVTLQGELALKEQRRTELSGRYLDRHPELLTVTRQIQDIQRHLRDIDAKQTVLAEVQREVLALNREKQVSSEIHVGLLNTRNKIEAVAQSNEAYVRLVDRAESPMRSVTLGLPVMIAMACLLGLVLGVAASIVKNALAGAGQALREQGSGRPPAPAVSDPGEIERPHEKNTKP